MARRGKQKSRVDRKKDGKGGEQRNGKDDSRTSVRWSAVPLPCLRGLWLKLRGEQGSGLKGVDDLCFHTYGGFLGSGFEGDKVL